MQILKKKMFSAIALILMLTSTAAILNVPAANATGQCATYAFIVVTPHPVGINQQVFVDFWLSEVATTAAQSQGDRFSGFRVTITKPDGTTEQRGPFRGNDLSSAYFGYIPTMTGNYTFKVDYPGEYFADVNTNYLPSTASYTLTVQQEPVIISTLSQPAQPGDYWTRPINGQNYDWSDLGSNWLMSSWDKTGRAFDNGVAIDPFTTAPKSAHVLWTKPMYFGGLIGAQYGDAAFFSGLSYEMYFTPPVILGGRLYYNDIVGGSSGTGYFGAGSGGYADLGNYSSIVAVDLYTGQTLFTIPNATLSFGQIYNYISPNEAGGHAYLWSAQGSVWKCYDPWTGDLLVTYINVPGGQLTYGPDGSILATNVVNNSTAHSFQLQIWNSTKVIPHPFVTALDDEWTWSMYNVFGETLNAVGNTTLTFPTSPLSGNVAVRNLSTNGYQYVANITNVPIGGTVKAIGGVSGNDPGKIWVGNGTTRLLAFTGSGTIPVVITNIVDPGISYWSSYDMQGNTLSGPVKLDLNGILPANSSGYVADNIGPGGVLSVFVKETMQWYAFNLTTGQKLWGPTASYTGPFGMYDFQGGFKTTVNGVLYSAGYDGVMHAFNATTGQSLWEFSTGDAGTLLPYGTWPFYDGATFADGMVIATTGDHGNGVSTLYPGEGIFAVNANTGKLVWNMSGWFDHGPVADGILLSHNNYDNNIYAFGKGPTATAVTTPDVAVAKGQGVMIKGTVTDQSPGAKTLVQQGKFNTVAAISEGDMSTYMAYLYEQQLKPANAKGVSVVLTAVGPDNKATTIGTVTSDMNGNYGFIWNPSAPGQYTITATFAGSASYGSSQATTYLGVTEGPAASPGQSQSPAPSGIGTSTPSPVPNTGQGIPLDMYEVAIAAFAIIIVVVAAAVILRRRK